MKNLKTSPFHTAFIISTAFLFGYVLLASTGYMLSIEPGLAIGGISRWCERIVDGIFREPANALSNLGFMVSGLIMFKVLSEERPRENQKFYGINKTSGIFAAAVIYLGPGSMLMHGTHTEWGQWADNLSMVMFIVFPWIYNLKCMGGWSENRFVTIYILVVATYGITRGVFGDGLGIGLDLFGLSIGLWAISECLHKFWSPTFRLLSGFVGFVVAAVFGILSTEIMQEPATYWWTILFWVPAVFSKQKPDTIRTYSPWFYLGIATYVAAFSIWLNQWSEYLCYPDSWFQPHAAWHLLSALSTWFFFVFFRTEKSIKMES
ncbi:MAG: hypothetical protein CMD96_02920 [Gammaproteobacteria bacterium]|nr:hypothetical protein [Gammaproteobacteria bacterium]